MKRVAVFLLLSTISCAAQPIGDKAYYCEAQFSGGLAFSETTKRWGATTFRPSDKFVLKLKYLEKRLEKDALGKPVERYHYRITTTDAGQSDPMPCFDFRNEQATVWIGNGLYFNCEGVTRTYIFNLKANRFLSTYLNGFIDGVDNNDNTPFVAGGLCTLIQ